MREAYTSSLVKRAQERLATLPLDEAAAAGFIRDRGKYFLNIAYPSMQAMPEVHQHDVYPAEHMSPDGRDVALYVHVPFCTAECYYCHYYKEFRQSGDRVDAYLDGVEVELAQHRKRLGPIRAQSVYIGGGTPSYLQPSQIERLFDSIRSNVSLAEGAEVSFEAHPESTDKERLATLRANGVNRLNIGIESFEDSLLAAENRRHTAQEALSAIALAETFGFKSVNLDLIYGLKDQTVAMWEHTLDVMAGLAPTSATMYYLRLKQKTPEHSLYKKSPERFPSEKDVLLMHAMNFERMESELGYIQKPVDWYIRDSSYFHTYQDHNWRRSDETELLGVGASAYSYMNGWQYYNVNHTGRYLEALAAGNLPIWRGEFLDQEEKMRRTVMLGIKMGMDRAGFQRTYGIDVVEAFPDEWQSLQDLGLTSITADQVELTDMGKLLADEVGQAFYSEPMRARMEAVDPGLVSTTWPNLNK